MWPISRLRRTSASDERLFDLRPRTEAQSEVINLRPPFLRRHRAPALAALAVLVISSLAFARFFTQASAAYFYPQSCLGTWKHVSRAEGKPEASESEQVRAADAALFADDSQDLFCGGFSGTVPEGAAVTRMQLRMAWTVSQEQLQDSDEVLTVSADQAGPVEDASPIPDGAIDAPPTTTGELEIRRIEPDGTPYQDPASPGPADEASSDDGTPPSDTGSSASGDSGAGGASDGGSDSGETGGESSFLAIPRAHAQEQEPVPSQPTVSEPTQPDLPQTAPPLETVSVEEPAEAADGTGALPETASSTGDAAADVPDGMAPADVEPGSAFLAVYYSTDGAEWNLLKNVTAANWRDPVDLPLTAWEDIAKLQVKVSRLPTLDRAPFVYLDGMELAAEYGDGTAMDMPDFEKDVPRLIRSNERYVIADTLQGEDGRRVLWLFERTENPQWRRLADEAMMASSTEVALRGATVFWLSRDQRSIVGYRADTSTFFSQTLERGPGGSGIVFENGRERATVQGGAFAFSDAETGAPLGADDDAAFSAGFWAYAASLASGNVAATTTTTTAPVASSTDAATTTAPGAPADPLGAAPTSSEPAEPSPEPTP